VTSEDSLEHAQRLNDPPSRHNEDTFMKPHTGPSLRVAQLADLVWDADLPRRRCPTLQAMTDHGDNSCIIQGRDETPCVLARRLPGAGKKVF